MRTIAMWLSMVCLGGQRRAVAAVSGRPNGPRRHEDRDARRPPSPGSWSRRSGSTARSRRRSTSLSCRSLPGPPAIARQAAPSIIIDAMRIGLFIPCYIDQFYPRVGVATLAAAGALRRRRRSSSPPSKPAAASRWPTPAATTRPGRWPSGSSRSSARYDYVVGPSGSCVAMVRKHYHGLVARRSRAPRGRAQDLRAVRVPGRRAEGRTASPASFRTASACTKAATACASWSWARSSERNRRAVQQAAIAARRARRHLSSPSSQRPDECCGFGGTFAVYEEAVSCMMGLDRIADHERGRRRGAHRRRHVVPDAPRRPHPPAANARCA